MECGGCNPLEDHKVLKCQEIVRLSVFLYQYIILLASLIYFWRGFRDPKDPLDLPLISFQFHVSGVTCTLIM